MFLSRTMNTENTTIMVMPRRILLFSLFRLSLRVCIRHQQNMTMFTSLLEAAGLLSGTVTKNAQNHWGRKTVCVCIAYFLFFNTMSFCKTRHGCTKSQLCDFTYTGKWWKSFLFSIVSRYWKIMISFTSCN